MLLATQLVEKSQIQSQHPTVAPTLQQLAIPQHYGLQTAVAMNVVPPLYHTTTRAATARTARQSLAAARVFLEDRD